MFFHNKDLSMNVQFNPSSNCPYTLLKTIDSYPLDVFPYPIEAGGNGNCALLSLLHQINQIKGSEWRHISKKELERQALDLRQLCAFYMQVNREQLARYQGFWHDLASDWDTLLKEELKLMIKSLSPEKVEHFAKTLGQGTTLEEAKLILIAIADNWRYNVPADEKHAAAAKEQIFEIYAEYIRRENVQLDSSFWNIYTKIANDKKFIQEHLKGLEFAIKQILVITKIDKAYKSLGFWPKEIGEDNKDISQCAFIYYNGYNHYQSFDRDLIVDYLTTPLPLRPKSWSSCTLL
jgi:hypothetical protein